MILVTGGAGYIGSHCVLALLKQNYDVVVFDNLSTGHIETINTLEQYGNVAFAKGDLQNKEQIKNVFKSYKIDAVIHFAAFSQVGESVKNPQKYYLNNVCGTLNLLEAMLENNVKKIVFSSTAATYGEPQYTPIDEKHPQNPINPYGQTKLFIEKILDDYDKAYELKSVRLRYFNVAGADSDNRVGEWHEPETHLIPNILKSTFGNSKTFEMYGSDYPTKDGTCVRDYINVEDLAEAHLLALKYLNNNGSTNFFNLGTKTGNTVKDVFSECEKICQKSISVNIMPRRDGDPASLVADNTKVLTELGWQPQRDLSYSIDTAYKWEQKLQSKI
ncbi:MAG: UDP-glucose 4-epimerase GalE [Cyanobacteria bacterium SIG31]|nr:UDP-glucose 4-epimerase GalE [Cyanobacteria bacterium SIG31]